MTELLSVVIPTHDRPERLAVAVRSVLDQEDATIEVVIVDDGSGPATADMIDRLTNEDHRVVAVRNDEAQGSSEARNRGIARATGALISFCDDDDAWLPGAARAALAALGPSIGVVYGSHQVHIETTGRLVTFQPPDPGGPELMRWINVPAILHAVARRDRLGSELSFDPHLVTSEDWDLWLRCSEVAPMARVDAPLYRYVQHTGSRVTSTRLDTYGRFLAKHRSSMTPACIAHHELTVALAAGDRAQFVKTTTASVRHPSIVGSAGLLATTVVAGAVGRRRHDPGLGLRVAARTLGPAVRRRDRLRPSEPSVDGVN